MRQISENANLVVAWLGAEVDDSDSALRQLGEYATDDAFENLGLKDQAKVQAALTKRLYWTRLWIIQELCVAMQVRFASGYTTFPWCTVQEVLFAHVPPNSSDDNPIVSRTIPLSLFVLIELYGSGSRVCSSRSGMRWPG